MRRGKRMVHRHHAFFLFAVFEERKIDDPEKAQVVRLPHFELTSELQPQVAYQRPYLVAPAIISSVSPGLSPAASVARPRSSSLRCRAIGPCQLPSAIFAHARPSPCRV